MLSFPGGRVEPDDDSVLASAQRETLEESGYEFKNWRHVDVWQPHQKIEWFVNVFVANGVVHTGEAQSDGGERITLKLLSLEKVKQLVLAGDRHLGETRHLFEQVDTIEELLDLPEYQGPAVNR